MGNDGDDDNWDDDDNGDDNWDDDDDAMMHLNHYTYYISFITIYHTSVLSYIIIIEKKSLYIIHNLRLENLSYCS